MTAAASQDLQSYCDELASRARKAARQLATARGGLKNQWLSTAAAALEAHTQEILQANARDLAAAGEHGLTAAQVDRLQLTPERLHGAASGLREVAALPDPVGRVLDSSVRPNGFSPSSASPSRTR